MIISRVDSGNLNLLEVAEACRRELSGALAVAIL
jgi:hypothetical protein